MKYIFRIIMAAVALATAVPSYAVTDQEMEKARTIAAQLYLRWANDGSGYLDDHNPSTMAELNKVLKAKEKENLQAFNAVSVPSDYAGWDKAQLVEYWSSTFLNSPGLLEKGKACKSRLKSKLQAMNVVAPAAAETQSASNTDASKPADPAPEAKVDQEKPTPVADAAVADDQALSADDSLIAQAQADAGLVDEQPHKSSHTGWYIAILAVLVGVVVWLVVYAAKTMRLQGNEDSEAGERQVKEAKKEAKEQQNRMREQFASSLAAKGDELKQCKTRIAELETELEAARSEIRRLKAERRDSEVSRHAAEPVSSDTPAPSRETSDASATQTRAANQLPPVVYLGYANSRGLFVKASRSLNPDSSVYRMDIPDGRNGSFMVVNDHAAVDRILSDPEHWLSGGCVVENPEDAVSAERIVTTVAGEAVFADNTCRVVKKARIRFI